MRTDAARDEGTRSSALWGRGSKSDRKRATVARAAVAGLTVIFALVVGVSTPAAATAKQAWGSPGSSPHWNSGRIGRGAWTTTDTYVSADLLAKAQADPSQKFDVIVQAKDAQSRDAVGGYGRSAGTFRRSFSLIQGVSMSLPGRAIVFLAQNPTRFGGLSITEDTPVSIVGQLGPDDWEASTRVDKLWTRAAVTCVVNGLGIQVDPTCTPLSAYTAPQAPAIAIVDSGVDSSKASDFGSRVVARVDFTGDGAGGDPLGHGTMVAGVAAGVGTPATKGGVAQNAPIVDLRVADKDGRAQTSAILAALNWVLQNKDKYNIRVVNLSLSGNQQTSFQFDPLDQAVEKLWLNGLVAVAAAGNNGSPTGPTINLGAPGNDPFIITVGATDTNGTVTQTDDFRAPWSAYGYTPDGFIKPDMSAPGRYIVAPVPGSSKLLAVKPWRNKGGGYMWMSGTSFSAPMVAGLAAQMLALHPSWTPDMVKGALMAAATRLASDGTGIGEVNAAASVGVDSPPNPNQGLYAFVHIDPATSLKIFDPAAWAQTVSTASNWVASNWVASNWVASNWVASNWVASNWVASNWVASNWVANGEDD